MEDTKVAEFFDSSMGPGKALAKDGSQVAMMHISQASRTSSYTEDEATTEPPSNIHRTWSPEENAAFNAAIPPRPQFNSFTGNLANAGSNKPVVLRKFNQSGIELSTLPQFKDSVKDSGKNPPPPRSSKFHSQSSPHISKQGSQSSLGDEPGQEL